VWQEAERDRVEVLAFGRLLYEMATGQALERTRFRTHCRVPSPRHSPAVLKRISRPTDGRTPSLKVLSAVLPALPILRSSCPYNAATFFLRHLLPHLGFICDPSMHPLLAAGTSWNGVFAKVLLLADVGYIHQIVFDSHCLSLLHQLKTPLERRIAPCTQEAGTGRLSHQRQEASVHYSTPTVQYV